MKKIILRPKNKNNPTIIFKPRKKRLPYPPHVAKAKSKKA